MQHSLRPVGFLLQLLSQPLHVLGGHLFGGHEGEGFRSDAAFHHVVRQLGILQISKVEDARPDGAAVFLSSVAFGRLEERRCEWSNMIILVRFFLLLDHETTIK